jgi:hypothetical protein
MFSINRSDGSGSGWPSENGERAISIFEPLGKSG